MTRARRSAFTLIELMAAMAITSVLVLIIVGLTSVGLNFWKSIREDVRSSQMVRPALNALFTDLEGMQLRSGNVFEWLYASKDSNQLSKNMMTGPDKAKAANAAQLVFFTSAADRFIPVDGKGQAISRDIAKNKGDVNAVAYRLVYRDQILDEDATEYSEGFPIFALYRNLVPAESAFSGGDGGGALLGRTDLATAYASHENSELNPKNFIAENIVEFTIAFEVEYENVNGTQTQKVTKTVPILASKATASVGDCTEFRVKGNSLYIRGGASVPAMATGKVVGVIISLTTLTDEGMTMVDQIRKNRAKPIPPGTFFQKYSRNYTQRFPVMGG